MADTPPPAARTPWHLWVVGVLSLLWNLGGAFDFFMTQTQNAGYLKGLPPAQLEFCNNLPFWVVVLWGVATWCAPLGSLLLLLRPASGGECVSRLARAAMVLMTIHNYGFTNIRQVMPGPGPVIFRRRYLCRGAAPLDLRARCMGRRGVLR